MATTYYKEPDEFDRTCDVCGERKGPEVIFIHDICKDCHDFDSGDCEQCYPLSVR